MTTDPASSPVPSPRALSVTRGDLETSRVRLSMMATILIFLGGFALAALMELPQAEETDMLTRLSPGVARWLEWLLMLIASASVLGALAGIGATNAIGVLARLLDGISSGRITALDPARFARDVSFFRLSRVACLGLTYGSVLGCLLFMGAFAIILQPVLGALLLGVIAGVVIGGFLAARRRAEAALEARVPIRLDGREM